MHTDAVIIAFTSVDVRNNTIFGLYIRISEKRSSELILLVETGLYAEYID